MNNHIVVTCPRCGEEIVEKDGKYGKFYGCSGYQSRGCRNIMSPKDYLAAQRMLVQAEPEKPFKPSKYQEALLEAIEFGNRSIFVAANPGSGKTTSLVQVAKRIPENESIIFCAFNKHIADELARRTPSHIEVATLHSIGLRCLRDSLPSKPTIDNEKVTGILNDLHIDPLLWQPIQQLVGLCKATLCDAKNRDDLLWLCERYQVDLNDDSDSNREVILGSIQVILAECMKRVTVIDFDDMIWLPIVLRLHPHRYQWVLVDESQDLNTAQIELVALLVAKSGRVIAVGDENQAIYGFRGADLDAISKLVTRFNMVRLPLSICYRCPTTHLDLVRSMVEDIEARENAPIGTIEYVDQNQAILGIKDGDLVICRTNAPLVPLAYTLIRQGKKATIRGRDIGSGLLSLIDRMRPRDLNDLLIKIDGYRTRETVKLLNAHREGQAQNLADKCETIIAMTDGLSDLSELRARIRSIFDDTTKTGVILSSVHRAKGDEADNVWILHPELMPHPAAKQPWEQVQEKNLKIIAYTRAKQGLYFVQEK